MRHHKNLLSVDSILSTPVNPDYRRPSGRTDPPSDLLPQILEFLRRHWRLIACSILAALAIAIVYLLVTPSRYTATSALMLDTRRMQIFQQNVMSELSFDASAVDSQLEVLKSEAVALTVIRMLDLTKDPEFVDEGTNPIRYLLSSLWGGEATPNPEGAAPAIRDEATQRALDRFKSRLTVQRVERSYVVNISFQSLDGDKAARIANAVGEAYILDQLQAKHAATRRATEWLKERIEELRQEAETADRAALAFRSRNSLTSADGKLLSEQQLSEISTQLVAAKAQTAEAKAKLDRILDISRRGISDAAVGDSLQNAVLNRLQQQYIEAARREAEFSSRYGQDHIAAANLRKEMQQIQDVSKSEMNRIAESYKSEYEIARQREQALQDSLDEVTRLTETTREAQVGLRQLESSASAYRTLHDNFLQRFVEATQLQSVPNTEARLITEAAAAQKSYPITSLVLAVAAFFGAGLGCAIAFVIEGFDHVLRTGRQVEHSLGIKCLGIVPSVPNTPARALLAEAESARLDTRTISGELGIARYVVLAPFSRFSEAIRAIKVAADTSLIGRDIKVIGSTSALPGEGKSTVAANLAQLMAHSGRRVLLIDADLRNPALTRRIAPQAEQGLLEVLSGKEQLNDTLWRDPFTGLDFLPAVMKSPLAHTNEVLASDRMANLLAAARNYYEYIIMDFPPVAPVVDTKAAAYHVDAFVFVIEWGKTSPEVVADALGAGEVIRSKILGAVLNKANANKLKQIETYNGKNYYSYYQSDEE